MDERARRFSGDERRVGEFLAACGHEVVAVGEKPTTHTPATPATTDTGDRPAAAHGSGRLGNRPDALVDGVPTDFVVLSPGDTGTAVAMALSRAARHADQAVIDARGSGLSAAAAQEGLRRFQAAPYGRVLRGWRVIGDGYEIDAMATAEGPGGPGPDNR